MLDHVDGLDRRADEIDQGRNLVGLLQLQQLFQVGVGENLLLDTGEGHELGGELVGVQRIERILVLQLGHQQVEEPAEFLFELVAGLRGFCALDEVA